MEPEDILSMLRRYGALIAAHVCIGALVGVGLAAVSDPVYTSNASALVAADGGEGTQSLSSANSLITAVMPTLVELGTSDQVLQSVSQSTGVEVGDLRDNIAVSTGTSSLIITVAANGPSPEIAQAVAQAEIEALRARMSEMSVKVQEEATLTLTDVDLADLPTEPSAPSRSRYALYGSILGGAVGGAIALVLFRSVGQRAAAPPRREELDEEHGPRHRSGTRRSRHAASAGSAGTAGSAGSAGSAEV